MSISIKEKIIFINQSSNYLMVDIINAYKNKYKSGVLITGNLAAENTQIEPYITHDKIIRHDKKYPFIRIYTWIIGFFQIFFKILLKYRETDLFIVSNPPISILLPLFFGNRFSFLVYDIYPDILISHGIIKKTSIVSKSWIKINKIVYSKAANLFTISEGMADNLSQYVDRQKIKVIPNWADTSCLKPICKNDNPFIEEHKIGDKFIILYSGNMGETHDIEPIIDVAEKLKEEKDILFLFIGDGVKKNRIERKIKCLALDNCLMLPFQKQETIPFSLGCADIGIVTLDKESFQSSVPSKTYNLMAVGTTLLCIGEKKSELGRLIAEYRIGEIFDKGSVNEIASFILDVKNNKDLHTFYCDNSRKASLHFTSQNALRYIE